MNNGDSNQAFRCAVESVERLVHVCEDAAKHMDSTPSAATALKRDIDFLNRASASLRNGESEDIESIWQDIQHLSRFFGGDYVRSSSFREQFETGCDQLFEAALNLVQCIRAKHG